VNPDVVIVDTGVANIASLRFALRRLGCTAFVSNDPAIIGSGSKVFIPGVGSAESAMKSLQENNLVEAIQNLQVPTLGICLGMQIMAKSSEESASGKLSCLSIVDAEVECLKSTDLALPHMGWNTVSMVKDSILFEGIENEHFYFVHSLAVSTVASTVATCEYGSVFSASVEVDNFYGVQFHPELSSKAGSRLLQNFLELDI